MRSYEDAGYEKCDMKKVWRLVPSITQASCPNFLAIDDLPFEWEACRRTSNDRTQVSSA